MVWKRVFHRASAVCSAAAAVVAAVLFTVAAVSPVGSESWYGTLRCVFAGSDECYVLSDAVHPNKADEGNVSAWKSACRAYVDELSKRVSARKCRFCMVTLGGAGAIVYDLDLDEVVYRPFAQVRERSSHVPSAA